MEPELLTVDQAEDAAANALADLLVQALERQDVCFFDELDHDAGARIRDGVRAACRELLRGPLDEDYSRQLGGYCMKAPTDPTLRGLGHAGGLIVEMSYTSPKPSDAVARAIELIEEVRDGSAL